MQKFSASLFFVLLVLASHLASAQGTIRRVNNTGITGTNIYSTIQLAHDASVNGDIIQVEPSTVSYGNLTCTKQLTIVGPGYFLSFNQPPALQASVIPATIDQVVFNPGSAGSSIAGMTINGNLYPGVSNLTIVRNYINSTIYANYNANISNTLIRQNYIYTISYYSGSASSTNLLITNNIILSSANVSLASFSGEFSNNDMLSGTAYFDNFTVKNNYINSLSTTANTTWQYNLLTGALPTLGSQSNNTPSVSQSSVFVLAPTAPGQYDAWYKLKTGTNPATGGGQGGVDIGATGSSTGYAYHFSGLPAIPAIYQLSQAVSGNTLNVTLGTRSNN
ncbi:hypothetical protein [Hymenobacter rubidus]|uniref:hypothetical protein n=1 Tax=Hymenobacter rubidus TaxID=1441626 RepID=UPI00191FD77E|nr:hypothetical protein [Hymenobacter rubidus]